MHRFIHPIHARGVQSPPPPGHVGKLLTDHRIAELKRSGYYGEAHRTCQILADNETKRKTRPNARRSTKTTTAIDVSDLLSGF